MGFFVDYTDTTRITFDDGPCRGTHMQVRTELSYVELQRLTMSGIGVELGENGTPRPVLDSDMVSGTDLRKMEGWIKAWTFPKKSGQASAPEWRPTIGDFERLTPAVATEVLRALARHEAAVTADAEPETSPLLEDGSSQTQTTHPESDGTIAVPEALTIS